MAGVHQKLKDGGTKAVTYSAFFKDAYTNLRYPAIDDGCTTQAPPVQRTAHPEGDS
jgi:hypothetical protein